MLFYLLLIEFCCLSVHFLCLLNGGGLEGSRLFGIVVKPLLNILRQLGKIILLFVLTTIPSASTRVTVASLYSFLSLVLKSSASAIDAKHTIKITRVGVLI